jgi:hypothetical protein
VEIYGENFSTMFKVLCRRAVLTQVWFDDVPSETFYRCEELLLCRPPEISLVNRTSDKICRERKVCIASSPPPPSPSSSPSSLAWLVAACAHGRR